MTSLVFGANGYIGKHLSYFLQENDFSVNNFDIHADSDLKNYTQFDITDQEQYSTIDFNVDYIFWFSGITGTSDSFEKANTFINVNEIGLVNLLNTIKHLPNKPKIIFPSTRLVYKASPNPLKETDPKDPITIYAINKLSCEHILKSYNRLYDIQYIIYRICVPYGNFFSSNYSYGTIGFFLSKAQKGENISLYGDGSQMRTFTHIEDLCHQIINSCRNKESYNKAINIGGENLSLKEVAEIIAKKYNVTTTCVEWPQQALLLESGDTFFDDSLIQDILQGIKYKRIIDIK